MGWWRNYIRQNTRPIDPTRARKWKTILSGIYFMAAWNLFAFTFYIILKEKAPITQEPDESSGSYYARLVGTGEAKVYHYDGLRFANEYKVDGEKTAYTYEKLQEIQRKRREQENSIESPDFE